MNESKTITAIEIGSKKTRVFLGEILDAKRINFVGDSGNFGSVGVKKGSIYDLGKAARTAQDAIVKAERSVRGFSTQDVCIAISGSHIKGFRNVGSANVAGADGIVRADDIKRAKDDAKSKVLADGRTYIHKICCGYYLDGKYHTNPIGLKGEHIDAEYWLVHGDTSKISELIHIVRSFGLELEHMVLSGIASALAVSDAEQKKRGVLVVDIGAGTSDYAYFKHGNIFQAGVIPIGGDHITNDLSFGLRLTRKNAIAVKEHCGKAIISEDEKLRQFWTIGDKQIGDKKISMASINAIIRARLEELFLIIREELQDYLNENGIREVVLTGGTSELKGICELASAVLELPCSKGSFESSTRKELRIQENATLLGLLEYTKNECRRQTKKKSKFGFLGELFKF